MGLSYATPVDLWACGCIFAELHTRTALFDGKYEKDQLAKIFGVLGTPADEEWPENAAVLKSNFASMPKKALSELVPELEPQGEDLLEVCTRNVHSFHLNPFHFRASPKITTHAIIIFAEKCFCNVFCNNFLEFLKLLSRPLALVCDSKIIF